MAKDHECSSCIFVWFFFLVCIHKPETLFFSRYMVSIEPFVWKDLQKTVSMTKLLKCESRAKQETAEPFYIQVILSLPSSIAYVKYCELLPTRVLKIWPWHFCTIFTLDNIFVNINLFRTLVMFLSSGVFSLLLDYFHDDHGWLCPL